MLDELSKAIPVLGDRCVILHNNQGGARSLIAIAAIAAITYVLYRASP